MKLKIFGKKARELMNCPSHPRITSARMIIKEGRNIVELEIE